MHMLFSPVILRAHLDVECLLAAANAKLERLIPHRVDTTTCWLVVGWIYIEAEIMDNRRNRHKHINRHTHPSCTLLTLTAIACCVLPTLHLPVASNCGCKCC